MNDPFAYYVPQTPRDSSRRKSFFHRSSPNNPTQFINSIQDGISTRLRSIGGGSEAEPPLQELRVSTLEDTIDSIHSTIPALETSTMSEIVTLLRGSKHPTAENLQTSHFLVPTADDTLLPTPTPVTSPQVSAPMAHRNYRDTSRTPAPEVPIISATSTPTVARSVRPNGSTTVPPEFDSEMKSPMGQRQRRRQEFISGHYWHSRSRVPLRYVAQNSSA
jgi:hypothetical protein